MHHRRRIPPVRRPLLLRLPPPDEVIDHILHTAATQPQRRKIPCQITRTKHIDDPADPAGMPRQSHRTSLLPRLPQPQKRRQMPSRRCPQRHNPAGVNRKHPSILPQPTHRTLHIVKGSRPDVLRRLHRIKQPIAHGNRREPSRGKFRRKRSQIPPAAPSPGTPMNAQYHRPPPRLRCLPQIKRQPLPPSRTVHNPTLRNNFPSSPCPGNCCQPGQNVQYAAAIHDSPRLIGRHFPWTRQNPPAFHAFPAS